MSVLDLNHARHDFEEDQERRCQATYGGEYCGDPATVWDRVLDRDYCDEHRGAAGVPVDLVELVP